MKLSPALLFLSFSATAHADSNGLRRLSRELQTTCEGFSNKTCKQTTGCTWSSGQCIGTTPATAPPTKSPLPAGTGICSDDSGQQCFAVTDCVCGSTATSDASFSPDPFQRRRAHVPAAGHDRTLQEECDPTAKRKDCPQGCVWLGGSAGCASPEPTPTGTPTRAPTRAPTPCSCIGASTPSPTAGPTPSTVAATYLPGERTVSCDGGKLLLSTGMDCKLLTTRGVKVLLANGVLSSETMHSNADGAAVIPHPTDNGWYYVSNSEASSGGGGVGTLRFNSNGDLIGYERQLAGTSRNCGGGRTPWNTWVSCEEVTGSGLCHEVNPFTGDSQQVQVVGIGGNYESFAYYLDPDLTAPNNIRYFVTEDASNGALTRYTPAASAYGGNDFDILNSAGGTYEYLKLMADMTFIWTSSRSEGQTNAADFFPRSEGIDVHDGILSFVAKSIKKLFTLDLEQGTWSESSTLSGAFNLQPDQLARIVGEGDILYFCEDGGSACDIHGRDSTGKYFTIVEGVGYSTETTGLAFSPDGMYMYVAFQGNSNVYSFWRTDGLPFNGTVADTKYHSP